jgi:hypothetical protein
MFIASMSAECGSTLVSFMFLASMEIGAPCKAYMSAMCVIMIVWYSTETTT